MDLYKKAAITAVSFGLLSVIILLTSFAFNQIEYHVIQNNIEPGSKLEIIYETGRNEEDEIIISGFTRFKED